MPADSVWCVYYAAGILDIPDDLINAAKIDGCGRLRIFFKVVLPMVKSSIIALSIFTFVGAWNNFLWPMVSCSKQEMKTLPLALGMMKTLYNTDVGLTMACAVINFLPPFIFYVFMQSEIQRRNDVEWNQRIEGKIKYEYF